MASDLQFDADGFSINTSWVIPRHLAHQDFKGGDVLYDHKSGWTSWNDPNSNFQKILQVHTSTSGGIICFSIWERSQSKVLTFLEKSQLQPKDFVSYLISGEKG